MKNSIAFLSLGLIISACSTPRPAPYELNGGKFYGKDAERSQYIDHYEDSDVNSDFVYKGRSGAGEKEKVYQENPDFTQPNKKLRTNADYDKETKVTSSKLAPPPKFESQPKLVKDHIDEEEETGSKSSNPRVPTSRDKLDGYEENTNSAPRAKSSDYLGPKKAESQQKPDNKGYSEDRSDKLKDIAPKEKPKIEAEAETKKPVLHVTAKEKPKHLEENKRAEAKKKEVKEAKETKEVKEVKEKPQHKEEAKATPTKQEELVEQAEEDDKVVVAEEKPAIKKPEPKIEAKTEPKPEPKVEAKAEPKPEVKKPEPKVEAKAEPKEAKQEEKKLEVANSEKPEAEIKKQDIASIPKVAPSPSAPAGKFIKPVDGKITQEFGPGNDGILFQAPEGTPVKAAAAGEVVYSGNELKGYGNMIVIKHPNGFLTAYSHLENPGVKKGTKVAQGDVIGEVGKTGNVQSPQLHFGVRKGRNAVNPRDYMN